MMKKIIRTTRIAACAMLLLSVFFATSVQADRFDTNEGDLVITPIHHASTGLYWKGVNVLLDPVRSTHASADTDLILLTDVHGDHLNIPTLTAIVKVNTIIVAPQAVIKKLPANLQKISIRLDNGKDTIQHGIKIEAIAMYNLPESDEAKHVKGRGNGYVLTFSDKRIYFSGDSADIKEMRELKNIDVAFVAMNLPYTMTVRAAASGVLAFKPSIVYPYHYRGKKEGKHVFSDVNEFKRLVNVGNNNIQVVLANWY